MKKECEATRSLLPRYLRGHLFRPQQKRIERHLAGCVVCSSEFDSLRRIDETRRFLKDVNPPEGIAARIRAGVSVLSGVRRLLFRPLWLIMIAAVIAASYQYVIDPLLHDPDIEKLDAGILPSPAAVGEPVPHTLQTPTTAAAAPSPQQKVEPVPVADAPKVDPLVVTITVEKQNEKAGIKLINDAMKEHALLKTMLFSDKVREISGSLTPDELLTFFNRVQNAGKITYKRSRLASAGSELLPFIIKLQTQAAPPQVPADRPAAMPAKVPAAKPVSRPEDRPAARPADIPVERPVSRPEDRPTPPLPSPSAQ